MAASLPSPHDNGPVRPGHHPVADSALTHEVAFYDRDQELIPAVVDYLTTGLRAGQPAVIIASRSHRDAFAAGLRAAGFDVERLTATGDLLLLDARRTLAAFLDGPTPDWELFQDTGGNVLDRVRARRPGAMIRAYGEMVDLLCRDGSATAAVTVEGFWKRMTRRYAMSLLCAYSDGSRLRSANGAAFDRICSEHDGANDLTLGG